MLKQDCGTSLATVVKRQTLFEIALHVSGPSEGAKAAKLRKIFKQSILLINMRSVRIALKNSNQLWNKLIRGLHQWSVANGKCYSIPGHFIKIHGKQVVEP